MYTLLPRQDRMGNLRRDREGMTAIFYREGTLNGSR